MWSEVLDQLSDFGGIIEEENSRESNFIFERNQKYFQIINTQVKFGIMETPLSPGTMPFPESQTISFSGWS